MLSFKPKQTQPQAKTKHIRFTLFHRVKIKTPKASTGNHGTAPWQNQRRARRGCAYFSCQHTLKTESSATKAGFLLKWKQNQITYSSKKRNMQNNWGKQSNWFMDYTDINYTGKPHSNTNCNSPAMSRHWRQKSRKSETDDNQNTRQLSAASIPNHSVKYTTAIAQSIFMTGIKGSLNAPFIFYWMNPLLHKVHATMSRALVLPNRVSD